MAENLYIDAPGGFVPASAIGFDDGSGRYRAVTSATPLPTVAALPQTQPALTGECSGNAVVGPYAPAPFAPVYLQLTGTWTGTVRLMRSHDGGATQHPVTLAGAQWASFTVNVCEPVWVESEGGVTLWLDLSATSGTIAWRLSQ